MLNTSVQVTRMFNLGGPESDNGLTSDETHNQIKVVLSHDLLEDKQINSNPGDKTAIKL